ncbi:GNAT family N-acetyltransferase [Candidatus Poribacteria bacterium]|nr:GNAT family N-acetyltransferase [Candidatus Poribacteria bacterium]
MDIRPLSPDMLPALADFTNANLDLDAGRFTPDLFDWHLYHDTHVRPEFCLLGMDGDRIIACALGVVRGAHAWIKLFGVARDCRRLGIGTRLFAQIESAFAEAGARRVHIGTSVPLYIMPGVDPRYTEAFCFLQTLGYRRNSDAVNMQVQLGLSDFDTSADEERLRSEEGITISRLDTLRRDAFSEWMCETWSEGWQEEALLSLEHDPVTTLVATRRDEFCGFVTYDVELFRRSLGPMGVVPECRNKRLGGVLARRCLHEMKLRGDDICEIAWVGPVAFYVRVLNARISKTFFHFTKSFDG